MLLSDNNKMKIIITIIIIQTLGIMIISIMIIRLPAVLL